MFNRRHPLSTIHPIPSDPMWPSMVFHGCHSSASTTSFTTSAAAPACCLYLSTNSPSGCFSTVANRFQPLDGRVWLAHPLKIVAMLYSGGEEENERQCCCRCCKEANEGRSRKYVYAQESKRRRLRRSQRMSSDFRFSSRSRMSREKRIDF